MKLMQINLWGGRIQRPLLELIKAEKPDIITVQEAYSFPVEVPLSSPWSYFSITERLTATGNLPHTAFATSNTFPIFGQTLRYGNAILSKYPLENTSVHYTGGPGPLQFDQPVAPDHNVTRNFQHATVTIGKTTLNLINHHGHWVNQPLGDEVSTERLETVAGFIKTLSGPVIMAGDLNLSPDSPAIQQFINHSGFVSALAGTDVTTTLSGAHYVDRGIICDYVLSSPELKVTSATASDTIVSDHKAVIVEIDV
jgi:endonuclease/exonuclease/phosphatase family metal-dependent hydrolase